MSEARTSSVSTPDLIGGRYRLRSELGRGGMASVHRAHDEVLGRDVAIKLLHGHLASEEAFLDRFRREARAAAGLSHPNIVAVHDWGETDEGPYIVLELVEGMSLREVLQVRGRLTPAEALALLGPAAAGVAAAHQAGLVHRDVKPENVLIGHDGNVKIADFGLARAAAASTQTFGPDTLVGSPHYLSPEAVDGRPLDARSDVYSLGVVLFECLTGRPPFQGDSPAATAVQHTTRSVPPPSAHARDVPAAVDRVVTRATAADPADRHPDAAAFALALTDAVPEGPATIDLRDGRHHTVVLPRHAIDTIVGLDPNRTTQFVRDRLARTTETEPGRPRRRWRRALLAIALLALLGAAAWLTYDRGIAPQTPIPAVVGATETAAVTALEDAGFRVVVAEERRPSLEVAEGSVVVQSPADGTLRRGGTVTLVLSSGPRPVTVPSVSGMSEEEAVAALEAEGVNLRVTVERAYDPEVVAGEAVRTEPPAGSEVDEASEVVLVVSQGREPVEVPDVRKMDRAAAVRALEEAGLEATVVDEVYDDDVPAGAVISQSPGAGESVLKGDPVELVLSRGPAPVTVPDVRGKQEDEARAVLTELGLEVEVIYVDTIVPFRAGKVDDQDPSPGTEARRGDTVRLFVWR